MRLLAVLLALAAPSSAAAADRPKGFVELDKVDPTILHDMRYATRYNFVGRGIDGSRDPACLLHRRAARALAPSPSCAPAATALERAGFEDYATEWWHFTLADERYPGTYFDFPVARRR